MTIKQFIEKAVEGGCRIPATYSKGDLKVQNVEAELIMLPTFLPALVLIDPDAWRAVGRVEGWWKKDEFGHELKERPNNREFTAGKSIYSAQQAEHIPFTWMTNMHRMIDALADGKTIEEFLASL
jgi:hypothetical protein